MGVCVCAGGGDIVGPCADVIIKVKLVQQVPRSWGVQLDQGAGGEGLDGGVL